MRRAASKGYVFATFLQPYQQVRMLFDAYRAAYKEEASTFGGYAYDGLMLAVDAIKRAGSTDKAKVRDAIEATKGYVGSSGVFNMSPTDHMGLELSSFRLLEIKNGDWTIVN